MTGAERVGGEQDRDGIGAGCGCAEDEALLQPDAMRREPDADGGEPREEPGLGARHRLGGREDARTEKRERQCGDRGGRHPGNGLVEDQLRRCIDEEHVRRGDAAVDERSCLQARIAHPQGDEREEQRLGRPGEREARSRQQVGGGDGGKRERRHAEHEGKGRLEAAKRDPGDGPDHGRAGERDALVAVDVPQRPHEQEREADGGEHERARERIEVRLPGDELQPDSGCEHDQHERGDDGGRACTGRGVGVEREQCNLRSDDDADPDQELVPATRHCQRDRRAEDDHRERHRGPRQPGVDRLQGRGERRPEQPDRGDRLGRPRDRDHDGERREAAGERQREPVGHELVAGCRGGQGCIATRDACAGGAERHLQLAVARAHPERSADGGRGDAGAERDPHRRRDPAAVRGEHEEQDDAERRDGSADDREAARAEQVPVARRAVRPSASRLGRLRAGLAGIDGREARPAARGDRRRRAAPRGAAAAALERCPSAASAAACAVAASAGPACARTTDSARCPRGSTRAGAEPPDR